MTPPTLKLLAAAVPLAAAVLAAAPGGAAAHHSDRLVVSGTGKADTIALRTDAEKPKRLLIDYGDDGRAERKIPYAAIDKVVVRGRGGDDRIHLDESRAPLPASLAIRAHGGRGTDTVARSGSDVHGDSMEMAAEVDPELARVSNGASHATLDAVEAVELPAGGGADRVGVFDLTGTDVTHVATSAGPADGAPDQVIAAGTGGDDMIEVVGEPGALGSSGPPPRSRSTTPRPPTTCRSSPRRATTT